MRPAASADTTAQVDMLRKLGTLAATARDVDIFSDMDSFDS
jgi:hypothetical protein